MEKAKKYQEYLKLLKKATEKKPKDKDMKKMKKGGSTEFGMLSVKAGIDNNPKPTAADRIAGAKMKQKPKKAALGMMMLKKAMENSDTARKRASVMGIPGFAASQKFKKKEGGEIKGFGAARQKGQGLQDENLIPGKSMDYYKDLM